MTFSWPWQYSFPPFYTCVKNIGICILKWNYCLFFIVYSNERLQPNVETERKRLEAWKTLILDYCRFHKIYLLDIEESASSPLFQNKSIDSRPKACLYFKLKFYFFLFTKLKIIFRNLKLLLFFPLLITHHFFTAKKYSKNF